MSQGAQNTKPMRRGHWHKDSFDGFQITNPIRVKQPRTLTYERFGGRFNNQVFQFVSVLQHATLLNRTLIVPPETNMVEWTGMFNTDLGLWNLSKLNGHYNIDWKSTKTLQSDKECVAQVDDLQHLLLDKNKFKTCSNLHLKTKGGLLFCGAQNRFCGTAQEERLAYDIYKTLMISNRLKPHVIVNKHAVGVHSRTHGGRHVGNGDEGICTKGIVKTCQSHLGPKCNAEEQTIQCHIWDVFKRKTILPDIVLASDKTYSWSEFPTTTPHAPTVRRVGSNKLSVYPVSTSDIERISQILLELFSLVSTDFFFGNLYSTLTLTVCMLRGEARKYKSNVCWILLHPGERFATPPTPRTCDPWTQGDGMILTSSHPLPKGESAYIVKGNGRVQCSSGSPLRSLSLSDTKGAPNNFDIHRYDCTRGDAIVMPHGECRPPQPKPWKGSVDHVICLAPLYGTDARWLKEWIAYHKLLGFHKIVVPSYHLEESMTAVLQEYSDLVEIHEWTPKGDTLYERGKLFAWNQCYLDHFSSDLVLFVDIDELLWLQSSLSNFSKWTWHQSQPAMSLASVTQVSAMDTRNKHGLLLRQWNESEKAPLAPFNAGKYHLGRWKYVVSGNVEPLPHLLWTHSVGGLDYNKADTLMKLVPAERAHVRHYQTHFLKQQNGSWKNHAKQRTFNPIASEDFLKTLDLLVDTT